MITIPIIRWIYLFLAAISQVWWTYSLKYVDVKKLFTTPVSQYLEYSVYTKVLFPAIGYIVFGTGNIIFFSLAIKEIPTAVAFTIWVAIAIVGLKLLDVFLFKASSLSYSDFFFYTLILIGIIGVKKTI